MFIMIAVASLCGVLLMGLLMREACRHRRDLWITTDDAILCAVSPTIILLGTFGAVALGYRLTHGGLAAVSAGAWVGSGVTLVVAYGVWRLVASRIRESGRRRAGAAVGPTGAVPVSP